MRRLSPFPLMLGIVLSLAPTVRAQIPVTDAANFAKNFLTALQTAKSNINEAVMIKQQIDSYYQQAKNLTRIPLSLLNDIQRAMRDYRSLLTNVEGISYQIGSASSQIEQLYGGAQGTAQSLQAMTARWTGQVQSASKKAMQTQAIVDTLQAQQARLGMALSFSDAAEGNLQVQQAANQLAALQIEQQAMLLEMQAASARVEASFYAQIAASQQAAMERGQQWLQRDLTAIPAYRPPGQTSGGIVLPAIQRR